MSNDLQVYRYTYKGEQAIRTTVINGEAWFVAKDVCDILGMTVEATRRLDEDEKGLTKIQTPGGMQDMTVVSEPGLYKLIMKSNKPEAKQFTRWVTHEVLPSIHKSGMYLSPEAANAYMTDPEAFAEMAARCSALERKVEAMEKKLNETYSFTVLGQTVLALKGAISFKDGATFFSQHGVPIGQNRLYKYCREKGSSGTSRRKRQWMPDCSI